MADSRGRILGLWTADAWRHPVPDGHGDLRSGTDAAKRRGLAELDPGRADFNLINNFTFIIQLGAGLPALASLAAQFVPFLPAWAQLLVQSIHLTELAGIPPHPYYELGSYYLIVAGAINYFAVCNLHDRILRPQARYQAQEQPEEKETPAQS